MQMMKVLFDTGSAYLWVPGPACINCTNRIVFMPSRSSTYSSLGYPFHATYVKAPSFEGIFATDNINVGGMEIIGQSFGETTRAGMDFDGVLGLQLLQNFNARPAMINAISQGLLASNVFGIYLKESLGGEIMFGSTNPSYYNASNVQWAPILIPGRWSVLLNSCYIGNIPLFNNYQRYITALILVSEWLLIREVQLMWLRIIL
jgi:hypothetical protein